MNLKEQIYTTFYNFFNKCILHHYTFKMTYGLKKGFGFFFLLYLIFFFLLLDTSFCEYNVEYQENDHDTKRPFNKLWSQKNYTLSELFCNELPKSEIEDNNKFTPQQKKLLVCATIVTVCVVALFFLQNGEINDLQKKVQDLEKKAALLSSQLGQVQGSSSKDEWQRPKNWQFGFGF